MIQVRYSKGNFWRRAIFRFWLRVSKVWQFSTHTEDHPKKSSIATISGMSLLSAVLVLHCFTASGQSSISSKETDYLPSGSGKDVVTKACVSCHTARIATSKLRTEDEWANIVSQMMSRGAVLSDDEVDRVVEYLAKNFGHPDDDKEKASSSTAELPNSKNAADQFSSSAPASISPDTSKGSTNGGVSAQDWPSFGNDPGAMRYSPLSQINISNVSQLKVVWQFDTHPVNTLPAITLEEMPMHGASPADVGAQTVKAPGTRETQPSVTARASRNMVRLSETIPIVIGNVLYMSTGYRQIIALDAETGKRIWQYDSPHPPATRGVSYWPGAVGFEPQIVYGTLDGWLVSLDAKTGVPSSTFGIAGMVDLKPTAISEKFPDSRYSVNSPPAIYKNYVIPGCGSGERPAFGTKCDVRAFDLRTGKLVWTFHTVPRPGELNHGVWKDGQWEDRSGVNSWGFATVDVERGMIFLPLGTPNTDFYGGNRTGSNLYGTSVVALDANTGKLKWFFQTVHHDNWDYDDCSAPILITVKQHGKAVPAVAQVTKQGLLFLLNRETGKPIYGVKEVPVENDNPEPGDSNWPTQPMPIKPPPLARNTFSPDELATVTPEHEKYCRDLLALEGGAMTGGPFAQYGPKLRTIFPSWTGGTNWGGGFFDPKLGYYFVDTKDLANFNKLVPDGNGDYTRVGPDHAPENMGDYFWDGNKQWPCQKPPWARLIAVNVNTGNIVWQVPLGSFEELDKLGVPKTGTPTTNGGGIVTAGGLIFIGATSDGKFRAFDSHTGKELWISDLGVDIQSIPSTWMGRNGKQYVAIYASGALYAAGGSDIAGAGGHHGAMPGTLYVYTLP